MYLDECHLHTHPHLASVWQRRGQPQLIPAAGINQRATVFGALEYRTGQVTSQIVPKASSETFAHFAEQVVTQWADAPIVLVLDNASYHKSATLRHWFRDHADQVDVLWLPTSSPQLNLIERVWRALKTRLACHRLWHDQPGLITFAHDILDRMRACFGADAYPHITLGQDLCRSA